MVVSYHLYWSDPKAFYRLEVCPVDPVNIIRRKESSQVLTRKLKRLRLNAPCLLYQREGLLNEASGIILVQFKLRMLMRNMATRDHCRRRRLCHRNSCPQNAAK